MKSKDYVYIECEECEGEGHFQRECGERDCNAFDCAGCSEECEKCHGSGKIKVPKIKANLIYDKKDIIH
jgi:DnaJ-class molecular chaperone